MAPRSLPAPSRTHHPSTEQRWRDRVVAWQRSGLTADVFVADKPYSASTLHWWSSRLRRAVPPTFVELRPRPAVEGPRVAADLLVEVGAARVRVTSDFDPALLAAVVRALSEPSR